MTAAMSWSKQFWTAFRPLQCGTAQSAPWLATFKTAQLAAPPWSQELLQTLTLAACDLKLRPITFIVALTAALVAFLVLLLGTCSRLMRHDVTHYPPTPHSWYTQRTVGAPVVCSVCYTPVVSEGQAQPLNLSGGGLLDPQLCLYCQEPCEVGLFAVEPVWCCSGCHASVHVQCYAKRHPHHFTAATRAALESQSAAAAAGGAPNPYPHNSQTASSTQGRGSKPAGEGGRGRGARRGRHHHPAPPAHAQSSRSARSSRSSPDVSTGGSMEHLNLMDSGGAAGVVAVPMNGSGGGGTPDHSRQPSLSEMCTMVEEELDGGKTLHNTPMGAVPAVLGASASVGSGDADGDEPQLRAGGGPLNAVAAHVPALDICTFGRHRQAVLPATSVRVVFDAPLLTAAQAANSAAEDSMSASPSTNNLAGLGSSSNKRRKAAKKSKASWWQRRAPVRFKDYRIGKLPVGCRPLLVFVNLKSGPQAGTSMKRQLLQLLHPLQVVELPREKPELALRCFAFVPGLRVLVVGGDGTVGWVLQCLDALALSLNEPAPGSTAVQPHVRPWRPPPVAVLPLGTGNDLAGCLNWGRTLGEVIQRGLPTVLLDVLHAAPLQLDQWNVHIAPAMKPRHSLLGRHNSSMPDGTLPTAAAHTGPAASGQLLSADTLQVDSEHPPGGPAAPAVAALSFTGRGAEVKVLNNYLGIGIDAMVALEFHQIRENYPTWFQSQVGNKMWYAGVGAKDLLGRSCGALYKRLQVVCDGVEIVIPPDAEGVLILNIASFMGGVDAWAHGTPGPVQPFPPGRNLQRRQSMQDGLLEVVAVYGALHLGQLQVGISQVTRLCQGSSITINTQAALPMQIDGEPWMQPPGHLQLSLKGHATMLRRLDSSPEARFSQIVWDVLEQSEQRGVITAAQRQLLATELNACVEHL